MTATNHKIVGPIPLDSDVHLCIHPLRGVRGDSLKSSANLRKRGVLFSDAVGVLEDELALTIRDPYSEEEERWITVGMDLLGDLLVVVYAWRGETIRFISARRATPHERQKYEDTRS